MSRNPVDVDVLGGLGTNPTVAECSLVGLVNASREDDGLNTCKEEVLETLGKPQGGGLGPSDDRTLELIEVTTPGLWCESRRAPFGGRTYQSDGTLLSSINMFAQSL